MTLKRIKNGDDIEVCHITEHKKQHAPGYVAALVSLLEQALKVGFELTIENGKFIVKQYSEEWEEWDQHTISAEYSYEGYNDFISFEFAVKDATDRKKERDRIEEVRRGALNKLSREEQEALGLIQSMGKYP